MTRQSRQSRNKHRTTGEFSNGGFGEFHSGIDTAFADAIGATLTADITALILRPSRRRAAQAAARQVDADIVWQEWQTASRAETLAADIVEQGRDLRLIDETLALLRRRSAITGRALARGDTTDGTGPARWRALANKVPEVTLAFWVIKILSTTVGETVADYLAVHVGLGVATTDAIMGLALAAALTHQLRPLLSERLVIPAIGPNESIHAITSLRRELFYWTAILFTFALGTAAGDLATEALGLGFDVGVFVFAAAIAVVFVVYRFGANAVGAFWAAYILTRPLGASLGDLLSQSRTYGGLGLGTVATSAAFLLAIAVLVTWLTVDDRRAHAVR